MLRIIKLSLTASVDHPDALCVTMSLSDARGPFSQLLVLLKAITPVWHSLVLQHTPAGGVTHETVAAAHSRLSNSLIGQY